MKSKIVCGMCGITCSNNLRLSNHLRHDHEGMTYFDYLVQYQNLVIPKCVICMDSCEHFYGTVFRKTCGKATCVQTLRSHNSRNCSEETRKKLSESTTKWMRDNYEKTAFGRRSSHKQSWPEHIFQNILDSDLPNLEYEMEKPILQYRIDFAVVAHQLAIEIDGKQHETEDGRAHDARRDVALNAIGWQVLRIPARLFYHETVDSIIDMVKDALSNDVTIAQQRLYTKYIDLNVSLQKTGIREAQKSNTQQMVLALTSDQLQKKWTNTLHSSMGFSSTSAFRRWLKRNMPEFVETHGV